MQVEGFDFQRHGYAVDDNAAAHGCDSTVLIRFRPEQTENEYPEEGCLQAAEGKHINLPDYAGRINGDGVDQEAENNRRRQAVKTNLVIAELFVFFALDIHVHILNDRGGRGQQQGRNRGDGRCHRADDNNACPEGRKAFDNRRWHDVIDAAAVRLETLGENALAEYAYPGGNEGHSTNDDGTNNHRTVQSLGILVADAADNGLRQ